MSLFDQSLFKPQNYPKDVVQNIFGTADLICNACGIAISMFAVFVAVSVIYVNRWFL